MIRLRILSPLFLLVWMPVASAQNVGVNTARGFNVNGVYQMNGTDNVNTYNGNLTLTIPLGQAYPIGGGLSYQLRLHYNSNIWESELREECTEGDPACEGPFLYAYPHRAANAGIGWTLSLGKIYMPDQPPNNSQRWVYEAPDGAYRHFFDTIHSDAAEAPVSGVSYTRDGTYLRMREVGASRVIDFPTGEAHTFVESSPGSKVWRLASISNRYPANVLTLSYPSANQWILSDGFREHIVNFGSYTWDDAVAGTRMLVNSVVLKTFGTTTATYKLQYTQSALQRPLSMHTYPTHLVPRSVTVQVLTKVVLPDDTPADDADNRTYQFVAPSGWPSEMKLPTGGAIQWSWGEIYRFPQPADEGTTTTVTTAIGVTSRRTYDTGDVLLGEWTYTSILSGAVSVDDHDKEMKNTITDPVGNRTEFFFSVSPMEVGVWKKSEYGLPITRFSPDATGTRWLSQRFIPAGQTTPVRSTYLRYEHDTQALSGGVPILLSHDAQNRRIVSTRAVHDDDGGHFVQTDRSDFDGLGHHRTVATSSTIADTPARTTRTEYNPATGTYPGSFTMLGTSSPWLTETYTSTTVEEGDRVLRAEFCFDSNGFPTRSRALRNVQRLSNGAPLSIAAARSATDVISVVAPDGRGNPAFSELYGGDKGSVGTGSLCASGLSLGTRTERIDYTHPTSSTMLEATSQYAGFQYFHTDTTVDLGTGLPESSRDHAGIETTYQYDSLGRITLVTPTARATTKYVYNSTNPAEVTVTQYPAGTQSGAVLTKTRYVFDGFGKLVKEHVTMPDGTESRRETVFNNLGQTESVSELGVAVTLPKTVMTYDALGRTKTVTPPDGSGSLTEFEYVGERMKTRKSRIWTGSSSVVPAVEVYDGYGRLVSVEEKSGPTSSAVRIGSDVLTSYRYDPAGRLVLVTMKKKSAADAVQQRLFDYDGRGFLLWESHPESGVTSYVYDARGLVVEKNEGAAGTLFDLQYQYDAAGRLTHVRGRNPFFDPSDPGQPAFRIIKSFAFSTVDGLSEGKLLRATRYNYPDEPRIAPIYKIEHEYTFFDDAGRPQQRLTYISSIDDRWGTDDSETLLQTVNLATEFDDLDRQKVRHYPTCLDCGMPPETPLRTITTTYSKGRVVSLSDFVPSMTYSPNGLRHVLTHSNTIADTQTSSIMTRPDSIGFATYKNCAQPVITSQPSGGSQAAGTVTLSVTATGSAGTDGLLYRWFKIGMGEIAGATSSTYQVPTLTAEGTFWVEITGACGYVESQYAIVTPSGCVAPETGVIAVHNQADGSKKLVPDPTYRTSPGFPRFEWRRTSDNQVMGTSETLTVASLTATTTYSLKVTDACGDSAVTTVTLTVAPPMPTTLTATRTGATQITVTWPSVAGQSTFKLERRSGIYWEFVAQVSGTSYVDGALAPGRTYAYRLTANGAHSNTDVASTWTFVPVAVGGTVGAQAFADALGAVNKVREASGWPAVTWDNILSTTDPLPEPGATVLMRHITACRARMNEALQALGALVTAYADPDLTGVPMKAAHVNDIYARAQ